ncbi:UNKNOWN [Stylonychia lemnae]|uniref:Potassium channel domain-containing protein n=1 Tax=Stylonychia lemnae TaxID=5949 RepID=A0A078AZ27_STYLE|nr:UNKNOWN [Stylonychia lemnae]|eukprot:CDW86457.1 UNKNOWN [Stylonychia lemnae]
MNSSSIIDLNKSENKTEMEFEDTQQEFLILQQKNIQPIKPKRVKKKKMTNDQALLKLIYGDDYEEHMRNNEEKEIKKMKFLQSKEMAQVRELMESVNNQKRRLKLLDFVLLLISILNMIIAYLENVQKFSSEIKPLIKTASSYRTDYGGSFGVDNRAFCVGMRYLNILVCFILDIGICFRYSLNLRILKIQKLRHPKDNLFSNKKELVWLLTELSLCSLCIPPNLDLDIKDSMLNGSYIYGIDGIILLLTMCKSYLLVRVYIGLSVFSTNEYNKVLYNIHKFHPNNLFCIRSDIKYIPFIILAVGMQLLIIYTGLFLLYSERSFEPFDLTKKTSLKQSKIAEQFESLTETLWLAIVSIITVGYGDIFPQTHLGRFFIVMAYIFGQVLLSILIVAMIDKFRLQSKELRAYFNLKIEQKQRGVQDTAANIISMSLKLRKLQRFFKDKKSYSKRQKIYSMIKDETSRMRMLKMQVIIVIKQFLLVPRNKKKF